MTSSTKINPELLPIKDALSLAPYSRDYITRLAREKKIVAVQVDRQWFIDPVSLKNFYESTRMEETVRMQRLSEERKRALATKEEQSLTKRTISQNLVAADQLALWQAALVVMAGLLVGATIFAFQSGGATSYLAGLVTAGNNDTQTASVFNTAVVETPVIDTVVPTTKNQSVYVSAPLSGSEGVLLLPTGISATSTWHLEQVFSDEVEVQMLDNVRGVVRLKNRPEAEPLVFLRVPVAAVEDSNAVNTSLP